jgi:photosystem II stability/assembly factor-like uncharacterized protein
MIYPTWAKTGRTCLQLAACTILAVPVLAHGGNDRLETPAFRAAKASGAAMLAIVCSGNRLIAAGEYGVILYSDTNGKTWRQAEVPVSVTLTALHFPVPNQGWAVGHDGVILHSSDNGAHWVKQFDGNQANALLLAAAEKREREAGAGGAAAAALAAAHQVLDDARAGAKFGPSRPLFDVWFKDGKQGLAVGSFGQIFRTRDGGKTWDLGNGHIANPDNLHYNALSHTPGGALLIAGEAGKVYRSMDGGDTWATLDTGYPGQLYGAIAAGEEAKGEILLAYGFGGHVFRSADNGVHWQPAAIGEKKPLVAGMALVDGAVILLSHDGKLLRSADRGASFKPASGGAGMPASALVRVASATFIVAGAGGTRFVSISDSTRIQQP